MIKDIIQRLHELNALLTIGETIGTEQAYTIASFFRDFSETNEVIAKAIRMANADADRLQADVSSLLSAITEYENANHPKL